MILLVWIKLMNPLQAVFQDFFLLVKMIALMIGARARQSGPAFAMRTSHIGQTIVSHFLIYVFQGRYIPDLQDLHELILPGGKRVIRTI